MQMDLKRRADEIEKKTKEVDLLNRKYEKLQSSQQGGPEAGSLPPLSPLAHKSAFLYAVAASQPDKLSQGLWMAHTAC